MTTTAIRQKSYDYIRGEEVLEEEIEENYDHWNDKDFVAELERYSADRKSDKSSVVRWMRL